MWQFHQNALVDSICSVWEATTRAREPNQCQNAEMKDEEFQSISDSPVLGPPYVTEARHKCGSLVIAIEVSFKRDGPT